MYSCVDDVNDGCLATGEGTTELIVNTRHKTSNSMVSDAISSPPVIVQ